MLSLEFISLVAAALLGATISGVVGMAGGVTLLGVMSALMPASQVVPIHGIIQLISNSTRTVAFLKHVNWRIFFSYTLPLVIGIWIGAQMWQGRLDSFRPLIGVFIIGFLLSQRYLKRLRNLPLWSFVPLGGIVGALSLYIGATGPLIAPFFLRDDMSKEQVIATKAACQTWGHLLKIPAFLSLGFNYTPHLSLLLGMSAAVIVGTLIGKKILSRFSRNTFTLAYKLVLAILAVYLIVSGLMN